ncbi:hypothetical protein EV363DRAFT_1453205 [Boletus edulis]|nr:hypothetical protein EV363DRAFT_1453205 [Boletus edulis]
MALDQPTLPLLPPHAEVCKIVLADCTAQLDAANAHFTIAQHYITSLTEQLANKSRSKQRKLKKLHGVFEAEDAELEAKEKAELEKAENKRLDDTARILCINQEIDNHIFNNTLTSYKRKDHLITLAGTLSLPMDGTVVELTKAIKDHLTDNPS